MRNPWEEIKLDDYEKHMSLDSVKQLVADVINTAIAFIIYRRVERSMGGES